MRTLTWVSPLGHTKTVTIGGRRRKPVSSAGTRFAVSLDTVEQVFGRQRARVERRLQQTMERVNERRLDGMTRQQALVETTVEMRR